jgi:hypothetical protein
MADFAHRWHWLPTISGRPNLWATRIQAEAPVAQKLFNPQDRAREKQDSREHDARALANGEKSREQLWRENSAFASMGLVMDLGGAESLV